MLQRPLAYPGHSTAVGAFVGPMHLKFWQMGCSEPPELAKILGVDSVGGTLITHVGTKQIEDVAQLASMRAPTGALLLLVRVVRDGIPQFILITGSSAH